MVRPSLLTATLPGLVRSRKQRALWREMRRLNQQLPAILENSFLDAMRGLTDDLGTDRPDSRTEEMIRNLAELVVVLDRRSSLGLCLRRSITLYHFLRKAGLPVEIHFGARPISKPENESLLGHAWLTLDGMPYFESGDNQQDFITMISFPNSQPIGAE